MGSTFGDYGKWRRTSAKRTTPLFKWVVLQEHKRDQFAERSLGSSVHRNQTMPPKNQPGMRRFPYPAKKLRAIDLYNIHRHPSQISCKLPMRAPDMFGKTSRSRVAEMIKKQKPKLSHCEAMMSRVASTKEHFRAWTLVVLAFCRIIVDQRYMNQ